MDRNRVVISRTFKNVDPEKVFAAWTDPMTVARWYGPEGFQNTIHEMDVRVGGRYRLTMTMPNGTVLPLSGSYRTVERPHRLSFTWKWGVPGSDAESSGQETLVSVSLRAVDGGTEMTLIHETFENDVETENHNEGWTSSLNKLAKFLAG
jgi:uncharacterized protein YndB with AHSA1/START domain